ncbi:hypothetical protein SLEP1_g44871 [Rubroshorea leprosula]|uniref:NAC domain-containing protein n=1 Tax=Rubroshorea leprosula TaxID=152421 RepID=A0AAV5LJP8_9ROSI|nr:hypothetical protein SLEP1_g44871 [Rubroshorea leprosula]
MEATASMPSSLPLLPPGFRFHPTDEELIIHYLKQKVSSLNPLVSIIADVNIYKFNPWELPEKANFGDTEWFFFSPRDRKYPKGGRPNRAAASGYWKATGTDKPILSSTGTQCLGVKKALVFYKGRPPKGEKTNWMMMEYRLLDDSLQSPRLRGSMRLDDWVLCRVCQRLNQIAQQTGGGIYDSSCSNSPSSIYQSSLENSPASTILGSLQGQEVPDNNILKFYEYELQHSMMAPLESEDEQGLGEIFQECSPEYPDSAMASSSNSVKNVLKSIERALSVGSLDDLVHPKKRLNATATSNRDNMCNGFEIPPNTPTTNMPCFSLS